MKLGDDAGYWHAERLLCGDFNKASMVYTPSDWTWNLTSVVRIVL